MKKKNKYYVYSKEFNTFSAMKSWCWYNMTAGEETEATEAKDDVVTKCYKIIKKERKLIVEKTYDAEEEMRKELEKRQLKLF